MMKLIDNPLTEMWKGIERIKQLRANSRYFWFRNPDKYKANWTEQNNKGLKLKKCVCGCKKLTYRKYAQGGCSLDNYRKNGGKNPTTQEYVKLKLRGINNGRWKGGKRFREDGYLEIRVLNRTKSNYILEHRLVMEKHLRRYLKREEIVHHKDGNKLNNKLENLLLIKNQSEHMKLCNKIKIVV